VDKPFDFKLTRHSDLILSLYKQPLILRRIALQLAPNLTGVDTNDYALFGLQTPEGQVALKALSSNARLSWTKQLERAIKAAKEDYK